MLKSTMRRANVRFTYRDYLLLPEDKRYEILDGDLSVIASPNTKHQRISRRFEIALAAYVEKAQLGEIFDAPYDVILSDENIVQPDLIFVSNERLSIIGEKNIRGAPDLVIEILSEATRERDLEIKRKIYARHDIQEYWIVDPDAKTVEVLTWSEDGYRSAGIYACGDRLSSQLLPELNLLVADIFKE